MDYARFGLRSLILSTSIIIPLVKNKSGDLTDAENYRAIMISN